MRIIEVAPEYGEFPQNHFWELVFGELVLGVPVKWEFLFPKNERDVLPFLGISAFGKRVIYKDIKADVGQILGSLCRRKGIEIIEKDATIKEFWCNVLIEGFSEGEYCSAF